ncbi:MAG: SAM-dependent methyltransferase, partial [Pyrinomonadaceae bacterium]|nr:SAM-dependent methyltransferase [Pyrinomonadaceae bacterium]
LRESLADGNFIKLTLGNYKGSDEHLQKIQVRIVETKKGSRLFVQFKYETRDVVRNYDFESGIEMVAKQLVSGFHSGHLFTTGHDYQLDIGKRNSRLNIGKPSIKTKPSAAHDREKKYTVDPNAYYLHLLGITTDSGQVRAPQQDKWKQINKFVEVLAGLYARSDLKEKRSLRIVDMGSGKGYLTFAAYDHFANTLGLTVSMTGVDIKREQVAFCDEVARTGGFDGLEFVEGTIDGYDPGEVDILIALHACDTASDDAIFKGISSHASIIVAAPCCHREVRAQMSTPPMLAGILRHPVMLDRTAEILTDGLRSMLLETSGYSTRMFEFVSTEHTPKNNMIVAVRSRPSGREKDIAAQISTLKAEYGIGHQRLADRLYGQE